MMIGISTLLTYGTTKAGTRGLQIEPSIKAPSKQTTGTEAKGSDQSRYYVGTMVLISSDNLILSQRNSVMQRFYDLENQDLIEKVTTFDKDGVGVSAFRQKKHVDTKIQSNKQHVTYSTILPNDGGKISVVDVEVIEGLFSEYRIYDSSGNLSNTFFRWGTEITKSEYQEKLAKLKWDSNINLRAPANDFRKNK